jgi:hypothetical protein
MENTKKNGDDEIFVVAPISTGSGARGNIPRSLRNNKQHQADWELWAFIPQCELWQAVALSLDLEPPKYSHEVRGWPSEYERRLKIATAHIECKNLAHNKFGCENVNLPVFCAWAQSLGWGLPDKFPCAGATQPKAPSAANTKKYLTKQQIITAFEGLHFDDKRWSKYLASPPEWLKLCCKGKGKPGDNSNSSQWDPVLIAVALNEPERGISVQKLDAAFASKPPLKHWADEWRDVSEYLR